MKRFILTPRAKRDVNEIWDYIAGDSIEAADRVLKALEQAILKLPRIRVQVTGARSWRISGIASFPFIRI